jgi:hypothetical protein
MPNQYKLQLVIFLVLKNKRYKIYDYKRGSYKNVMSIYNERCFINSDSYSNIK